MFKKNKLSNITANKFYFSNFLFFELSVGHAAHMHKINFKKCAQKIAQKKRYKKR